MSPINFESTVPRIASSEMTAREWLSLGVLCVVAAERAEASGDLAAMRYYTKLARKCDRCAETKSRTRPLTS